MWFAFLGDGFPPSTIVICFQDTFHIAYICFPLSLSIFGRYGESVQENEMPFTVSTTLTVFCGLSSIFATAIIAGEIRGIHQYRRLLRMLWICCLELFSRVDLYSGI